MPFGVLSKDTGGFPLKMCARGLTWALAAVSIGVLGWALAVSLAGPTRAADDPVRIVVLGDSLSAGYNLSASAAFPARLERALAAKGHAVKVANAGVSGDTASGGLARLDWSVPPGTEAVVLELGANDMLRAIDPKITRAALEAIMSRLKERRVAVLLAGMRAIPNLGVDYVGGFETIYVDIAAKYDPVFYPFFLEGIAGVAQLNQRDGLHPTAAGIDKVVAGILPKAEELVARVHQARRK
jgi:acyl-CoA thioesterase-1